MAMPGLVRAIAEKPGMFFLWDARNGSGSRFALDNNKNPRDFSCTAELWVRFCISWQISCSCRTAQDFVEVAPRREFSTWEIQLPFEKGASWSSQDCEKRRAWQHPGGWESEGLRF